MGLNRGSFGEKPGEARRVRPGVPAASSDAAKQRMLAIRQHGTAAELAIRSALDECGMTYKVDCPPIAGIRRRADLVFDAARVAVFVDGCFWHACPVHATWPKQNADWWRDKIETNRQRDADTDQRLAEVEWAVVRVWEHEEPAAAAARIVNAVRERSPDCPGRGRSSG